MLRAFSRLPSRVHLHIEIRSRGLQSNRAVSNRNLRKMSSIGKPPRDPNTLSNYNNFLTTHTEVNFNIDFEKKNISGSVVLTLKSITDAAAKEILLDTSFLNVKDVILDGKSPSWELLPRFEPYGSALKIILKDGVRSGESVQLEMTTETTKDCTAIQWLTPAQTRSEHPYMFTQCQAIHTRSVFPCQDTPDVKGTFQFNIKSPLPVIASGLSTGVKDYGKSADDAIGTKLHTFEQKVPIPSYLFALASGDIAKAPIGPRSVVATGPKELRAAQWEFEESTERYIETVEVCTIFQVYGNCADVMDRASFFRINGQSIMCLSSPRAFPTEGWRTPFTLTPPQP